MTDTERFLIDNGIHPSVVDMDSLCRRFLLEMQKGLDDPSANLPMIPTYFGTVGDIRKNSDVIVIDAGGTNLRSCLASFDDRGRPVFRDFRKIPMPGYRKEVSASEFFSIFADQIERFIDECNLISICYSYAADITPEHEGYTTMFCKEIMADEVIGKPICRSILDELARRGHDIEHKRAVVLNDAVSTYLAGTLYGTDGGNIGFILGTGINVSYLEDGCRIGKIRADGSQIINVECGHLEYDNGEFDRQFFEHTENPQWDHFEKMTGGAYLGDICHHAVLRAIEFGLFSDEFSRNYNLECISTKVASDFIEFSYKKDSVLERYISCDEDRERLCQIFKAVIERAAKMAACAIAAAVLKTDCGSSQGHPAVINVDGTTYYRTYEFDKYVKYYLNQYLKRGHGRSYRITSIDQAPITGAALAAFI